MGDTVGVWDVALSDGLYRVEFDHGTTTGKRVVRVNGKEVVRHEWMFRLVGVEQFTIGKAKCAIRIEPVSGFSYQYVLDVNGKSYKKFVENQSKIMKTWCPVIGEEAYRVVLDLPCVYDLLSLEKDTLDVWVNGNKVDTAGEFVENGTETHFEIDRRPAYIKAVSSGNRREGLVHTLVLDGQQIPESAE